MKRLFLFAILAALGFASCKSSDKQLLTFTLNVSLSNFDGKQITVQKRTQDSWLGIDSAKVENGVAHLKGTIENPEMLYVSFEGIRGSIPFFAEASEITIKADLNDLRQAEINGSAIHARYLAFNDKNEEYDEQLYQHYQAIRAAEEAGNEELRQTAEEAFELAEKEKKQFLVDFIRTNNKDIVAQYILYRNSYQFDLDELESLVINFDEKVKSVYLDELFNRLHVLKSVAIGMPFVDFEQTDSTDSLIKLSDHVGAKVLLIDFWASWCSPCRAENPNIVAIYNDYHDKGFDIFGVSFDTDRDKWMQAIDDDKLSWTHVSDLKGWGNAAGKLYGVQSIPHSVLLDANGVILAKNLRGTELREKIAGLLN